MENLTHEEQKIINTLGTGESMAITYKTLSWRTQIGERTVRSIVAHLVTYHHVCICTVSNGANKGGYFLASNREEFDHAHEELLSRIKKLSRRAKGLRRGYEKDVKRDEQLSLV